MEEHVLYFSSLCPDTKAFVEELQRQNISYREVDITASMANLKEFIRLRDDKPQFEGRKQWGNGWCSLFSDKNWSIYF